MGYYEKTISEEMYEIENLTTQVLDAALSGSDRERYSEVKRLIKDYTYRLKDQ